MTTLKRISLEKPITAELGSLPATEIERTKGTKNIHLGSAPEQTKERRTLEQESAKASAGHGGIDGNVYLSRFGGLVAPLKPSSVDQTIRDATALRKNEAERILNTFLQAPPVWEDANTGAKLLAIQAGAPIASGLDMGRLTAGLVMLSESARASGYSDLASKYLDVAEKNYAAGRSVLTDGSFFVQMKDFSTDPPTVTRGEPGKSAPKADGTSEDNMSRVNPRAYAIRAAAELYRATGKETYKMDLERYFGAWVKDFHDDQNGGFFIHGNVDPSQRGKDHQEIGSFRDPGGAVSSYDGRAGIKGNDGTIYGLSSILLAANELLQTTESQQLVKEQIDIILDKFQRVNGMLWENYTADWKPIAVDWQSQPKVPDRPMEVPGSLRASIQPADGVLIPGQTLDVRIPEPAGGRYNELETWSGTASFTLVKPDGSRLELGSQYFARSEMNETGGHVGHRNDPIRVAVPSDAPEGSRIEVGVEMRPPKAQLIEETLSFPVVHTSHVAIGGHTAMAPQQIIEGARQLEQQGAISKRAADRYVDRSVELFQDFATKSGAIDWSTGAVHNAIRVEDPNIENRRMPWGDAAWQQAELIQTLLRFREEGCLEDIAGPSGKTGEDLLRLAEKYYGETYANPQQTLTGFGNEWAYHPAQLSQYHHQVAARLPDEKLSLSARAEGAKVLEEAIRLLDGGAPEKLGTALARLATLAEKGGVLIDYFRDPHTGQSFAMTAAVRGNVEAFVKALAAGSSPITDINPVTGQTQAHFAAMIFDRGDGATGEILAAMERKIGLPAMVELVNVRVGSDRDPPLNLHTFAADAAFNRNNSAAEYIVGLHRRAGELGLNVDVTSPTARGFRPAVLIGQRPGAFGETVQAFFAGLPSAVRDRDGVEHANDADMRRAEHTTWARNKNLPSDRVLALIDAMEASNFDATLATLKELGLDWNSKVGFLGQTPLYFNTMSPSAPDAKLEFQRRALQAGASAIEVEDGLMRWHLAGRQGALSAAANFANGAITGNSRLALETLEHIRNNSAKYGPAYRWIINERGIINGRTLIADAIVAGNWPLALRLVGDRVRGGGLGADASILGYDRASLLELAQKVARDTRQVLPPELVTALE